MADICRRRVEFVGYDDLTVADAKVLRFRTVTTKKAKRYEVVLNKTPFYAESGGQHGDKGWIAFGDEQVKVIDTQKENDLIIHVLEKLPSDLSGKVEAKVDHTKRQATSSNHSAVHLMHAALHNILGKNALQKGQDVDDKRLRFDFSHFQKVTDEELRAIEHMVNEKIRQNIQLEEVRHMPIDDAKKLGAMMLFGEKYGETVRVITFDKNFSQELCGGTHVQATGEIGLFKILSESGVAAGIRRIEAVTADHAEAYMLGQLNQLEEVKAALKNVQDPVKAVVSLQEENKSLKKQVEQLLAAQASALKGQLKGQVEQINGINFLAAKLPLQDANAIKTLAYNLEAELGNACLVFAADLGDKPLITIRISESLTDKLNAGAMVRELAKEIQGGGGGQAFFATAGGKDVSGLDRVVEKAKGMV
ncbi:MAG: DHHA1 domain-containing protein [Saprospiraceae bacterium]